MSFDWTEYFILAQEIMRLPGLSVSQETCTRCALSRAYYAAYHKAYEVAQVRDGYVRPPPGQGNVHESLIRHFQRHADPARQDVGVDLDSLKIMRGKVDYEDVIRPPYALNASTTAVYLQLADHLLTKIAAL